MNGATLFWLAALGVLFLWWKDRQQANPRKAAADFAAGTTPQGLAHPSGAPEQVARAPRTMEDVTADVKRILMERTAL